MKKYCLYILIFSFAAITDAHTQNKFRTIIPLQPVIAGESFQVQFVIKSGDRINNIIPPSFRGFKFVSGPNAYSGTVIENGKAEKYQNLVFTLTALKKGRFRIGGAVVHINGKAFRSNEEIVDVISSSDAALLLKPNKEESEYFLSPAEDPLEKIKRNLFLKVEVDRNTCYIGEPVVATFKLYSRLQSRSEVLKNPGFYGFGVYDIVGLNDRFQAMEMINGRAFDVHTIRKVQLYPFQSGDYTIDPMELHNEVEFSRSSVRKKLEQEITEGINSSPPAEKKEGIEIFETTLSTTPVHIRVKPLPEKNKPADFNGAVGEFKLEAFLKHKKMRSNEGSVLEVSITGTGNFPHINAPVVHWPPNIASLEMQTSDSLSRVQVPLTGKRTFRYPFVVSSADEYIIPPVRFSYFNPHEKKYQSIETTAWRVEVSAAANPRDRLGEKKFINASNRKASWLLPVSVIFFSLLFLMLLAIILYKRSNKQSPIKNPVVPPSQRIESDFKELKESARQRTPSCYVQLKQYIWNNLAQHFHLKGSELNRNTLIKKLEEIDIPQLMIADLIKILDLCEMYSYNEIDSFNETDAILDTAQNILISINNKLGEVSRS